MLQGAALCAGILGAVASPGAASEPPQDAIAELTSQLFPSGYCDSGERKSFGIWTFDPDRIPVTSGVADRVYAAALSELIARKPACVDVLDGSAIREIAEHLKRTGAFRQAGDNPLLALEHANRAVSVLLRGEILAQDGAIFVSFRAVERERGVVLAQTKPWRLPGDYVRSAAEDVALNLDFALERAANRLVSGASGMRVIIPLGLYYQDTGAQPPLARYVLAGLMSAIEAETTSLVSGSKLRVLQPQLLLAAKSGAVSTIDDFDPLAQASGKLGEGVYELSGRYWQVGDAIDLKLSLRSQTGETVSWQGRIRLSGLPNLASTPKSGGLGGGGESAFLLQMTSPRGSAPYYQPGEALTVFLRSERDAWLSCFYIDVNGTSMQVLPNSFQNDRSAESRISASVLRSLPDPRRDPFEFRFTVNTLGEEALRCFAATKDPSAYLPDVLKGGGFTPLPSDVAERIADIFHSIPGVLIAEANLTVTVGTGATAPASQEN
jgi:hypothetical protein